MTDIDKIVAEAVERGFRVLDDPHLEVPAEYDSAEEHALNESARHAARAAYAEGLEAAAKVGKPTFSEDIEGIRVWHLDSCCVWAVKEYARAIRALKEEE